MDVDSHSLIGIIDKIKTATMDAKPEKAEGKPPMEVIHIHLDIDNSYGIRIGAIVVKHFTNDPANTSVTITGVNGEHLKIGTVTEGIILADPPNVNVMDKNHPPPTFIGENGSVVDGDAKTIPVHDTAIEDKVSDVGHLTILVEKIAEPKKGVPV